MFKSTLTILAVLATIIIILASCSQQQVSDDKVKVEVLPQVEILPVEEVEYKKPVEVVPISLSEEPVHNKPAIELSPEPPAKPDTVILSIGRHEFTEDKFPFKSEFKGGVEHVLCYPKSSDSSWLVCR